MPHEHIRMENRKTGDHIDFQKPASVNQQSVPFTDTDQIFRAKSLYLSLSVNKSGAIAPKLSNNDPCTSNCGKLIHFQPTS
jgi:hypothetical protein